MESLVSLALMLVVTGAAFSLINPNTATVADATEVMDMQQRARIGADMLSRDLIMAGAGVYSGPQTGALMNFFAPIIPRRNGTPGCGCLHGGQVRRRDDFLHSQHLLADHDSDRTCRSHRRS
jgi:hypothetical protein